MRAGRDGDGIGERSRHVRDTFIRVRTPRRVARWCRAAGTARSPASLQAGLLLIRCRRKAPATGSKPRVCRVYRSRSRRSRAAQDRRHRRGIRRRRCGVPHPAAVRGGPRRPARHRHRRRVRLAVVESEAGGGPPVRREGHRRGRVGGSPRASSTRTRPGGRSYGRAWTGVAATLALVAAAEDAERRLDSGAATLEDDEATTTTSTAERRRGEAIAWRKGDRAPGEKPETGA